MTAIETRGLTRLYGSTRAVDGLDLSIHRGEMFALLGVNGAGKTTAIKLLCGLIKPSSGSAEIMGIDVAERPLEVKKLINVSPQETAVAPNLTVRENLELICALHGLGRDECRARTEKMLYDLDLSAVAAKRADTLSGGWMRRLSIAMALITEPEILFLDEPTLGLDVLARRELWQHISGLKGKMTIILTTHYLEEAEALSDRIGIMAGGRLIACGTADELKKAAGTDSFEDAFIFLCGGGADA